MSVNANHPARRAGRALLCSSLLLLGGCTTFGVAQVSEPSVLSAHVGTRLTDDVLYAGALSISIKPENYYVSFLSVGAMLPLMPIRVAHAPENAKAPFTLVVQLDTDTDGYSIEPTDTLLLYQGQRHSPARTWGPLAGGAAAKQVQRRVPGHKWVCANRQHAIEPIAGAHAFKGKTCFVLEYAIQTLPPQERFSLILGGVKKDGKALALPEISFTQASRKGLSLLLQ